MRNLSWSRLGRRALLATFTVAGLLVALSGPALAANSARPDATAELSSPLLSSPDSDGPLSLSVAPALAKIGHGDEGLPAGAWLGIAVSIVLAVALLLGALPFILPKPPGSRSRH